MRLYDGPIGEALGLLEGFPGRLLPAPATPWPDSGEANLVLRSETAFELGGGNLPAIGGFAPTSSGVFVPRDEVWLYGPDLPELAADSPYARLAFARVAEGALGEGEALHAGVREVEYSRYRVSPLGFMPRFALASGEERVRVSRKALAEGLDFSRVGAHFVAAYRRQVAVSAVRVVFITLKDFPYDGLRKACRDAEGITGSLDRVFSGLSMDCAACDLKRVCDGVEGLRDLHFAHAAKKAARAS